MDNEGLKHPRLHWWCQHKCIPDVVQVVAPRHNKRRGAPRSPQHSAWIEHVRTLQGPAPPAVLEPIIAVHPQEFAFAMVHPTRGLFVSFDVWWIKHEKQPSKGYLAMPSPEARRG